MHKLKRFTSGNVEISSIRTSSNYKLANKLVSNSFAEIKRGSAADLVSVDYLPEHEITAENLHTHLIFGILQSRIASSIINGTVVMKDFELSGIDEKELNIKFEEYAKELSVK